MPCPSSPRRSRRVSDTTNPIRDEIAKAISEHEIILFMKGRPEQPMCGFSARTVAALDALGASYAAVDILPDPRIRQELSAISNWPTIPQLFVNGELVGGCDIVTEMYATGELAGTLGVEQPEPAAPVEEPATARRPMRIENRLAETRPRGGAAEPHPALRWDGHRLRVLDQTRLPGAEVWLDLAGAHDTAQAIRRLAVRGAPLIGMAAAYGLAMEVARDPAALQRGWEVLRGARPTAVNLAHAVDRVRAAALAAPDPVAGAREAAQRIHAEEDAASAAIAAHGARLLAGARRVATHCNTGALAAGGRGTALAVIHAL